jgi:PD-(D/E)XK nuclease superfamily
MAPTRIVIKASDVAAIIGMNRYKPRKEVMDDMWKKYSPETFKGLTKKDKAEQALEFSSEARRVLSSAVEIRAKDSNQVQSIFTEARDKVISDPKLTESQKTEVVEHLRSKIYTTHGTRSEDQTADKVQADENVRLVRDNSFYNYDICEKDDARFVITGKIDRIEEHEDGTRTLVEIKNRTNRLFNKVVDYEMVQVQVYLQMLGLVRARLVEQYNTQVKSHDLTRDDDMWDDVILPGLVAFCEELYNNMKTAK